MAPTIPDAFHEGLQRLNYQPTDTQWQQMQQYVDALIETNAKFNLTAIREPDQIWLRHVLESLTLIDVIDDAKMIADLGSGGGAPGLPLAIALPEASVHLIEATGKKARFLQQTAEVLGLDHVRVLNERAERLAHDKRWREQFDVVMARAVASMPALVEYALPLVKVDGRLLAIKGPRAEEELEAAAQAMGTLGVGQLRVFSAMPDEAPLPPALEILRSSVIVEMAKLQHTPPGYPRDTAMIKRKPL